jgi:hypothetical protein
MYPKKLPMSHMYSFFFGTREGQHTCTYIIQLWNNVNGSW